MTATREETLLKKFLEATGYEKDDVAALNATTLVVVTQQGGKFILQKGKFRRLLGPEAPLGDQEG
jgi:hypothetical protein